MNPRTWLGITTVNWFIFSDTPRYREAADGGEAIRAVRNVGKVGRLRG
jgi:hypothetical protein